MSNQLQFEIAFPEEAQAIQPMDSLPALPLWAENRRAFPVAMAVSSLFTAARGERKIYTKLMPVYSEENIEVYFKGEELREDVDKAVWLLLMHLARGRTFDPSGPIEVSFTAHEFLIALEWPSNGIYYKRLSDTLDRLQNAQVKVMGKRNGRKTGWVTMSFVSNVMVGNVEGKVVNKRSANTQWIVKLDHFAAQMYSHGLIEITNDQQYRELRTVSRKILDLVLASVTDVISISVTDLTRFLGGNTHSLSSAKQTAKLGLDELLAAGHINRYLFDGQNVAHITRTSTSQINRGAPTSLRIHKAQEIAMSQ